MRREARDVLTKLHEARPENQAVIALVAAASLSADGFAKSREVIWRAFRKAAPYADILSGIAMNVAAELIERESYLAARQHLVLAMRFAQTRDQQSIFVRLLEFDSNPDIPYPLRSVHSVRELTVGEDQQEAIRKAVRSAERGCFGQAAIWWETLLPAQENNAGLHYNLALCHAWNGERGLAAQHFSRASELESDFEVAAEYAALEQLLKPYAINEESQEIARIYDVPSASRFHHPDRRSSPVPACSPAVRDCCSGGNAGRRLRLPQ